MFACPVNAIHPNPHDPDFALAEMLYIDPVACVDCGACVEACPVAAIAPENKLGPAQLPFVQINALFHQNPPARPAQAPVPPIVRIDTTRTRTALRVAVVGSGPAALYAADELLKQPDVHVNVFERLSVPYGLVRSGVAPDHPETKTIARLFRDIEDRPGFHYVLGVDVGRDISHGELLAHHHAVIYATGASQDRRLGIVGEDLPGSTTATEFVAWYNGHPDHAGRSYDLSHERAVIVGNGNVALDVARILATEPEELAGTDISDRALSVLRQSRVREIVVLARRGPAQMAGTLPELTGLLGRPDLDVVVDGPVPTLTSDADLVTAQKLAALRALPTADRPRDFRRRIVLRYLTSPLSVEGTDRVTGVHVVRNELVRDVDGSVRAVPTQTTDTIATGLLLRSIGYRGRPVTGMPFDDGAGIIPNDAGRIDGRPGAYAVGWIKRGPTGFIGTNKSCARETVNQLLADVNAGRLADPLSDQRSLAQLVGQRCPDAGDVVAWRRIDDLERARGQASGRPRVKFTDIQELRTALANASPPRAVRRLGRRG